MNHKNEHTNKPRSWDNVERLNKRLEVTYKKSKADIWATMESKLESANEVKTIRLTDRPVFRWAVAASVVLVLGLTGLMRFYQFSLEAVPGQHLLVDLPDGSVVQLNAASSLSYHPYWWQFSRSLNFEGEAYFEVEKGSTFTVLSSKGSTSVLGTSFNIYSRDEDYRVACLTGKVRVTDNNDGKLVLLPNQKASLISSGFNVQRNVDLREETAWINQEFFFTSKSLSIVLNEIERQYGVQINGADTLNYKYTGNFNRRQNVEEVLGFVCKPFGIKFEKAGESEFRLTNMNP